MTRVQQVQMRMSELRTKIGELLDTEQESRSDTYTDDLEKANRELGALEIELRSALLIDDSETETRSDSDSDDTPEQREFAELVDKSNISDYIVELVSGTPIDGASAELRQETGLGVGYIPVELLYEQELETRADAVTNVSDSIQETQRPIRGRLFPASIGSYLNVQRPTVPIGTSTWVWQTGGTTADFRSDGALIESGAATFDDISVEPIRLTAKYKFGKESTVRIRGLESVLRNDIRQVLQGKLDQVAVNGQAAVTNVSPAVPGILSELTAPTNPSAQAGWRDYLNVFVDNVDGVYATSETGIRMLVGVDTYKHAKQAWTETGTGRIDMSDLTPARFRSSTIMPDPVSNIQDAILVKPGTAGYYQPVWSGLSTIVDEYTDAARGQVNITLVWMTGAVMVDSSVYARAKFKLVA